MTHYWSSLDKGFSALRSERESQDNACASLKKSNSHALSIVTPFEAPKGLVGQLTHFFGGEGTEVGVQMKK